MHGALASTFGDMSCICGGRCSIFNPTPPPQVQGGQSPTSVAS